MPNAKQQSSMQSVSIQQIYTGFVHNLTVVFQTFQDKITYFPDFSRHFVHFHVNKNITKLACKC